MIWLHLITAVLAATLGVANLALAKGTLRHRVFGWTWIAALLFLTLSSFGIRELRDGAFSWLHGLTVWTLFCMVVAIVAIRTGRVRTHAAFMIGTMSGLLIAGAFAFLPGRFIGHLLGY